MKRISCMNYKKVKTAFLSIFFTTNFLLFSQYNEIEKDLIACGITVYNKYYTTNNRTLIIETDSITSNNNKYLLKRMGIYIHM
ncbi:hypothetical protein [Tenacibaculum mesophilum]|uniref:hypothetical protein n=1 Tax=Tenacibaculum mesophilum TaxID=104268 RepID=UPI003748C19D